MRTLRSGGVLLALVLVLAACGGDDDGGDSASTTAADAAPATSTSAAPEVTTTTADDGDDDGSDDLVGLGDMPDECRDAFADYLRAIEPAVADLDFAAMTLAELNTVFTDLEPVLTDFDEQMEGLDCPDLDTADDAVREDVLAFVEDEAPGAVAFVAYSMDIAENFTGGDDGDSTASGDCETDIAAAQEIVDAGGTMEDLTMAELSEVGALFMSVQTNCSLDRMEEFFSQADVESFIGSGG